MNEVVLQAITDLQFVPLSKLDQALKRDKEDSDAEKSLAYLQKESEKMLSASLKDAEWVSNANRFLNDTRDLLKHNPEVEKRRLDLALEISRTEKRLKAERENKAATLCRDFEQAYRALKSADILSEAFPKALENATAIAKTFDGSDPLFAKIADQYKEFQANYTGKGLDCVCDARRLGIEIDGLLQKSSPAPKAEKELELFEKINGYAEKTISLIPNYPSFRRLCEKLKTEKAEAEKQRKARVADFVSRLNKLKKEAPSAAWLEAAIQLQKDCDKEKEPVFRSADADWLSAIVREETEYRTAFGLDETLHKLAGKNLSLSDVDQAEKLLLKIKNLPSSTASKMQNASETKTLQSKIKKAKNAEAARQKEEAERILNAAIDVCYEKATKGNVGAMIELADYYFNGMGVTQDYGEAFAWYEKAARKGSAKALEKLGDCYMNGYGVKENFKLAEKYYKKASKKQ